ncbi:PAS domain S-box protein [Tistrella mobilis]|uniref:sensor histidine kinase n=1 Tax=Tistrella mobilis TaxID=171437 RepID=UPI0035571F3E
MAIDPVALNRRLLHAAADAGGPAAALVAWTAALGDATGAVRATLWQAGRNAAAIRILVDWKAPGIDAGADGPRCEQVIRLLIHPRQVLATLVLPAAMMPGGAGEVVPADLARDLGAQLKILLQGVAAEERAATLAAALDAGRDGVVVVEARPVDGPPGRLVHVSRHFDPAAAPAVLPPPLDRPGMARPLREAAARAAAQGEAQALEMLHPGDGTPRVLKMSIQALPPARLFEGGWLGVLRDPAAPPGEAEVIASQRKMIQALYDANPLPMWIYDEQDFRLLSVNEAMVGKYGYDRETLLGMTLLDLRPAEDVPALMTRLTTRASGHEVSGPWRHRAADGRTFYVEIATHRLDWEGRPAILTAAIDITDRELANRVLRSRQGETDRLLRMQTAIIDTIPAQVWLLDVAGNVMAVNRAWSRFAEEMGETAPDVQVGRDFRGAAGGYGGAEPAGPARMAPPIQADAVAAILSVVTGRLPEISHEYRLKVRDQTRWFRMTAVGVTDEAGLPNGAVVMSVEITDMKRAQFEIMAAQNRAIAASAAKSLFLAHMSHELRTPLNAVIGFADVIEGQMLGPVGVGTYRDYAGHIAVAGRHLLQIIDGLLDLANIESGQLSPERRAAGLDALVREAATSCAAVLRRYGATLDIGARGNTTADVDARLTRRMIGFLIDNAVRYGHRGGHVQIRIDGSADDRVSIDITDDGPGVPAERLQTVTEPFSMPSGSVRPERAGVGLGLPLARHYAELHGGRLELTDRHAAGEASSGLRVRITLPRHPEA